MRLGIIADDLTGAADTGIQFAKRSFRTTLLPFSLESIGPLCCLHEAQIVALNTDTRGMQAELAYDTVRNAAALLMQTLHPQSVYKKIDSTLRGNVGAEIKAVLDATGSKIAILAPAFPAYNRTTKEGIHFVDGQPLSRTEAASDPVSPVDESHIPTLIRAQTGLKVGHIGLKEVRRGPVSLQHSIAQHIGAGEKIIVFDAVTDDDLGNIAEAGTSEYHMLPACEMPSPPLMVGSAGLANQLSRLSFSSIEVGPNAEGLKSPFVKGDLGGFSEMEMCAPEIPPNPPLRKGGTEVSLRKGGTELSVPESAHEGNDESTTCYQLVKGVIVLISGSLSAVTSRQLDEVRRTGKGKIIPVDVHRVVGDHKAGSKRRSEIVSEVISAAEASKVIGVQSVKRHRCDGRNIEFGRRQDSPKLVVKCLGRIALQVVKDCPQTIRGMILTGGDTALAVFKHLGISQVRLVDEILPGIPYGHVADGEFVGLAVVTKAGAFGDANALVKCVDFLVCK